jgi:hypothetical protein
MNGSFKMDLEIWGSRVNRQGGPTLQLVPRHAKRQSWKIVGKWQTKT